jgi:hypothetical protein
MIQPIEESKTKECDLKKYWWFYSFPKFVVKWLQEQVESSAVPPSIDEVCVNNKMFKAGL